ncbi:hypothetical protein JRQ81_008342 [Phrynocephalus forsythii]|uniref:Transmembrane protein 97 n=1 Tax=Phrynocephalus forsythii TaxID=171643 RepID=A0A9Q0XF33_9SAUR|nr:hypothetical protein JRQ81_008342 [Phrynocephalus forsythii]
MGSATRALEWVFALYFLTHIPITVFIDLQALLPDFYPTALRQLLTWYTAAFKDPLMVDPPPWFQSFIYCECFLQLPFFPVAAYAFWKGKRRWIRTPAIVYAAHVATTLLPILAHFLFQDFSHAKPAGPETLPERLTLLAFYFPYLLIPLLILFVMILDPQYNQEEKRKKR